MNPYSYQNNNVQEATLYLNKDNNKHLHYSLQFPSAIDTGYPENSIVKAELYLPKLEHKVPMAILVHGMGDYSVFPCRLLARSLLKQGVACLIPYLTTHSKRAPLVMREKLPYLTPEQWFQVYQVSVVDIRQLVDWANTRAEIDMERLFVVGVSLGGFVSAIAMGVDKRIKAGILIVTGGNSNKLSWLSKDDRYRKRYRRTENEHLDVQSNYAMYLEEVSRKGFENVITDDRSFLTDPLTFANDLKDRPVQMINATYDKYIPREAAIDLWQACGKPPIKWIPSGHVSLWLWYPAIRKSIISFLKSSKIIRD
jgi:esterase/lipase